MVAVIGVVGTVTPVILSSLSSQPSNEPRVDIYMNGTEHEGVEITLANNGSAPATNLTLTVEAPTKIADNSSYTLNTVPVHPVKIEDRRLEAHIPKLVHGSGSIVKLTISPSGINNSSYYTAYVTYDQGSNMKDYSFGSSSSFTPLVDRFQEFFYRYSDFYLVLYSLLFIVAVALVLLARSRARRSKSLSNIINNITEIRRLLRDNSRNTRVFRNPWKETIYTEQKVKDYIRRKYVGDYILLDDFYTELDERNQRLIRQC